MELTDLKEGDIFTYNYAESNQKTFCHIIKVDETTIYWQELEMNIEFYNSIYTGITDSMSTRFLDQHQDYQNIIYITNVKRNYYLELVDQVKTQFPEHFI